MVIIEYIEKIKIIISYQELDGNTTTRNNSVFQLCCCCFKKMDLADNR